MLRDATTGNWIGSFAGHKGAVWSCHLDPTGSLAATASGDFSAKIWDAITGRALAELPHKHICKTCDFSPDSLQLATGGHEGLVRVYKLKDVLDHREEEGHKAANPWLTLSHDGVVISKVSWWTNDILIAAGADGTIRFWKIAENETEPMHVLQVDAEVRDMEIRTLAGTGKDILTVAAGSQVSFFDLHDKQLIHAYPMPIHFREEGGASLHPDGHKFVAGGSDLWVRVFCFETGQELECHKGHHGPIRCLRYAPDGKTYATGSEDGTIRLWKTDVEESQ